MMKDFVKKVFGIGHDERQLQNLVDEGMSVIDKLFVQEDKKKEARDELFYIWCDVRASQVKDNSIRAIMRRALAVSFCATFLVFLWAIVICVLLPVGVDVTAIVTLTAEVLGPSVLAIVIFYFTYYGASQVVDKAKNQFGVVRGKLFNKSQGC